MRSSAIYYYLDQDDGYAKGPYSWNDLTQLQLGSDYHIYNQENNTWLTFECIIAQISAESAARVRSNKNQNSRPHPEPVATTRKAETRTPEVRTITQTTPQTTRIPKPTPVNFPPAQPQPNFPPLPGNGTDNPMGISGTGCFILALAAAAILGVLFFLM